MALGAPLINVRTLDDGDGIAEGSNSVTVKGSGNPG